METQGGKLYVYNVQTASGLSVLQTVKWLQNKKAMYVFYEA